ncbi:MAG: hypothetical protein A3E38_02595 [Candidatus Moranbacteria bacterium RIFCSPHIGHO2_12_FULL_54_9]|nr:MAG: hypothetical protein A2878_02505 [Candidatus Moranbacteria bacterium RIFCSPHIGHO2_01_FULL_54_31]OGI24604.1 MAG: hypothetical protein A3E38_02595 [Candidatus Moranbacteria bacterium RIFCSPHIGHO2_12_FULL_54_9]
MQNQKQNTPSLLISGAIFALFLCWVTSATPVFAQTDAGDIESDISKIEKKLKQETQELNALKQDLTQINSSLTSTQALILRVQNLLNQTEQTIGQKEKEIANLEQQLVLERHVLAGLIQEMYFTGDVPLAGIVLSENDLLGFFQGNDNLFSTQEKMQEVIRDIGEMRAKVTDEKRSLEETKADHAQLLAIKNKQKQALVSEKVETQDDLEEQQATIAELQSKLNELKGDLNKLLGKSYDAKNIKDAIKFAASKTGVREGFLFGMLSVESRLGASVGGCDYKQSRMSAYRLGIFKEIASELKYDYKKLKVSCPPRSYKGTGGAMGAAQFMADTWKGYKSVIASRTGHNPPDPWNLTDGVMAMASKLSNDGGAKDGKTTITSPCNGKKVSVKWETYASMRYLGWSCYALNNYAKTIQSLSGNYKNL